MIYIDNSATSYPKPKSVKKAVVRAYDKFYANVGRNSSKDSLKAANEVYKTREVLATLLNTQPENIVFTYNATYALNMALNGVIREGMTVAIDRFSHNSALRPLYALSKRGVKLRFLESSPFKDSVIISSFKKLIKSEKIDVLVLNHTSNVSGKVAPVKALSSICKQRGITLILDASQAVGSSFLDMKKLGVDILASSGHKGLYGITGTGFLAVSEDYGFSLEPLISGGSGIFSMEREMPLLLPERLEAGTLGVIGISSMRAGAEFLLERGIDEIGEWERRLQRKTVSELMNIKGVRVYNADINSKAIVLFNVEEITSSKLADELEKYSVVGRAGYHCAPLAHEYFGTNNPESDGAMRLSFGYFNTNSDCEKVVRAVNKIVKSYK